MLIDRVRPNRSSDGRCRGHILGTGSALPQTRLGNEELCARFGLSPSSIEERTGVRQRFVVRPDTPEEYNSALGFRASMRALEAAGIPPAELDAIIYATSSPDTLCPATASWLQDSLNAANAFCFDLNAGCAGFIYGLAIADQCIGSGQSDTVLVVGCDVLSRCIDPDDRSLAVVMADAAGAVVLSRQARGGAVLAYHLGGDGSYANLVYVEAGGTRQEVTTEAITSRSNKLRMRGRQVAELAVDQMACSATRLLATHGLSTRDVNWLVPHQTNLRIIEEVAAQLHLPMERVLVNVDRLGNTGNACVPTAIDEAIRSRRIRPNDLVLVTVVGAGLTWGAMLLRW